MTPECKQFIENAVLWSMMGASLALVSVPEADREKFIDRWTTDAANLAVILHRKVEAAIEAEERRKKFS